MTAINNLSYRLRCAHTPSPRIPYHFPSQSYNNNLTHSKWIIVIIILAAWRSPSARTMNIYRARTAKAPVGLFSIWTEIRMQLCHIWKIWCECRLVANWLHRASNACTEIAKTIGRKALALDSEQCRFPAEKFNSEFRITVVEHPLFSYVNNVPAVFFAAAGESPFVTFANIRE